MVLIIEEVRLWTSLPSTSNRMRNPNSFKPELSSLWNQLDSSVRSWGLEFMIHRSLLLFLLKQNQSFLHLKKCNLSYAVERIPGNQFNCNIQLFILALFLCVFLGKRDRWISGKEETSFPAQGAAHRAQMLRCPRWQKEDSSLFLLQLKSCLAARTCL